MILPDYPIEHKDEDKLRRAPLASKVAELIHNFRGKESFVIGIEGAWGSGKTSFINLAAAQLKPEETVVIHFNPWNFSGQNELISDFFSTLVSEIDQFRANKEQAKKLKSIVSKLTRKSEVAISPEVSVFYGMAKFKVNDLLKWGGEEKSLRQERHEIDDMFRALDKKIVIVIDDIDRLDEEETRLVMKLVKMTANFPNTVFLLAYDRERVAAQLGDKSMGEEYLKKIIQVSFTLPKPDEQGLRNILFADLDETIKEVYGEIKIEGEDENRWGQIVYHGFPKLFTTIRDIKRFISSLRLNWSIVSKEDINLVDFIAIEVVRVFAPSVYSSISGHGAMFTSMHDDPLQRQGHGEEVRSAYIKEILDTIHDKDIRKIIGDILEDIFPQLTANYSHETQQNWRVQKRICAEERFGFYFQLGIPEGAISEAEIKAVLEEASTQDGFAANLLKFQTDKRLRPLLRKLLDYTNKMDRNKAKNITLALWNLERQIADGRAGMFDFDDIETQSMRLPYHAIKNAVHDKAERTTFVQEIVKEATTLYTPVHFVMTLQQELKEKEGHGEDSYLLSSADDLAQPKEVLVERIRQAAKSGDLKNEKYFAFLLYWWKAWASEDEAKNYVAELMETREGLLAYLKGFLAKVYSTTGNYNTLDKKAVADFVPQETLDTLIGEITDEDLAQMGDEEREAVELYRKPKNRPWD